MGLRDMPGYAAAVAQQCAPGHATQLAQQRAEASLRTENQIRGIKLKVRRNGQLKEEARQRNEERWARLQLEAGMTEQEKREFHNREREERLRRRDERRAHFTPPKRRRVTVEEVEDEEAGGFRRVTDAGPEADPEATRAGTPVASSKRATTASKSDSRASTPEAVMSPPAMPCRFPSRTPERSPSSSSSPEPETARSPHRSSPRSLQRSPQGSPSRSPEPQPQSPRPQSPQPKQQPEPAAPAQPKTLARRPVPAKPTPRTRNAFVPALTLLAGSTRERFQPQQDEPGRLAVPLARNVADHRQLYGRLSGPGEPLSQPEPEPLPQPQPRHQPQPHQSQPQPQHRPRHRLHTQPRPEPELSTAPAIPTQPSAPTAATGTYRVPRSETGSVVSYATGGGPSVLRPLRTFLQSEVWLCLFRVTLCSIPLSALGVAAWWHWSLVHPFLKMWWPLLLPALLIVAGSFCIAHVYTHRCHHGLWHKYRRDCGHGSLDEKSFDQVFEAMHAPPQAEGMYWVNAEIKAQRRAQEAAERYRRRKEQGAAGKILRAVWFVVRWGVPAAVGWVGWAHLPLKECSCPVPETMCEVRSDLYVP